MTETAVAVEDDPALLRALIDDAARTTAEWVPTAYWQGYAARIVAEIERAGLADFRVNAGLLKGFALGGVPRPTLPRAAWKRAVWRGLAALPGVSVIVAEHERLLRASHRAGVVAAVRHARLALDRLAEAHPGLAPPAGLANGGAEDAFAWRGHVVTADWVRQLARIADFYAARRESPVRAILEVGPGLGLSTLAHMALNPALETVVNVDIVPVLYVSTRFLASIPDLRLVDYLATREEATIRPQSAGGVTVYQLAPWQLGRMEAELDWFFNAYSFQEMEREICAAYAAQAKRLCREGAVLHSSIAGHAPGAGGQRAPVTMADLVALFADAFPRQEPLAGVGAGLYDLEPGTAILLCRA